MRVRELHESLLTPQLDMLNLGRSDVTGTGTPQPQPQPAYYSASPRLRLSLSPRRSPRLLRRREFTRNLFVMNSLDKHIQNEEEFILASAGVGWGGFCVCVESINFDLAF